MSNLQEQIKHDVIDQLEQDDRVDAAGIEVEVLDHTVVLQGTVPTHSAKMAAAEDCEMVGGVRRVDNQLSIR